MPDLRDGCRLAVFSVCSRTRKFVTSRFAQLVIPGKVAADSTWAPPNRTFAEPHDAALPPNFVAGRLEVGVNLAVAQRNQAAFTYRATALDAFNGVENSLSAIGNLRQQLERVAARRAVLERSLTYAEDRYRAGYSYYLETLDAQRHLFNTELAAVQLRESQLNALICLYQLLGGGWRAEPLQPG